MRGAKNYKPCKKGRVDVKHICGENDDSDEVSDPQYELFFESLKKCEKSYVLECEINDVSVYVKYEGENKFGGKCEPKCARKMRKDIGQVDGAADQNPRLPTEQAPANQHASDNVNDRKNEILKKKPDLWNKGTIKKSEVGFSVALSNRMDNLERCKRLKNMIVVQEDNIVTNNQSEPHGQARLRKADKGKDVAKAHYVPDSESVMWIRNDGNWYQSPDPRNKSESENQSESVGQVQPIKRKKEGSKCKNMVLSEHNPDTKKHLHLKHDPRHNSATEYQVDRANLVVPSEEGKEVPSKSNLPKVKKEKNMVTDDCVANRKVVNCRDNEPLYPKPSPENNNLENNNPEIDQTQPGKKRKAQSQRKLRKVVHGSYEIKDNEARRNDVAHIEKKPCPRNNQMIKNHIDQAGPKQSHRMFKEVIMKDRDVTGDRDSDVEVLDSASFYSAGNQGPFVASKKFHESMTKDDDVELPGRTSARFDFRRQVMNVLQKPYDKQEWKRLREAFIAGSYVKFYPELVRKLAIHRHRKGKCLTILRGFFFWLEKMTQEGSFRPWNDRECLRVDSTLL